jgi:hypothetical protein
MPIGGNVPIVEKTPIIKDVQITKELSYWKWQKNHIKEIDSFFIGHLMMKLFQN